MLSVYSSTRCTYKMQSLTMTQKDLAIDRRQIPAQRSAQRLGDRKGSGETNMGVTPHLVLWLQSNPLFCIIYLFIYITRQCSRSSSLSSSSSSHSRSFGVVSLASGARLPAHEGCAAQRHKVDLAGTTLAHRGEEDLLKTHTPPTRLQSKSDHRADH